MKNRALGIIKEKEIFLLGFRMPLYLTIAKAPVKLNDFFRDVFSIDSPPYIFYENVIRKYYTIGESFRKCNLY